MTPTTPSDAPKASAELVPKIQKEDAMWLQKEMINRNYHEIAVAHESGRKIRRPSFPVT